MSYNWPRYLQNSEDKGKVKMSKMLNFWDVISFFPPSIFKQNTFLFVYWSILWNVILFIDSAHRSTVKNLPIKHFIFSFFKKGVAKDKCLLLKIEHFWYFEFSIVFTILRISRPILTQSLSFCTFSHSPRNGLLENALTLFWRCFRGWEIAKKRSHLFFETPCSTSYY